MIYKTKGVCAREIDLSVDGDVVKAVIFRGGCDGNSKAIARLVAGMKVDDVIKRLEGITCGRKETSCPDQLARFLRETQERGKSGKF